VAVDERGGHDLHEAMHALDDRGWFEQVTGMSFEDVAEWTPERIAAVRDLLGGWSHNIKLADGIYTSYVDEFYPAHREVMEVINHALGGRFSGKRIVDIGCLEGYYAVECALQGAEVLGIEGKLLNIKKCEFVKSVLGVERLTFAQDDAMRVTRDRYGGFDVAIALGLIYHLDDPFTFLDNLARLCDGFVVIDTLVALEDPPDSISGGWRPELSALRRFEYRGREYHGRTYREYESSAPQLEKDLSVTASLGNEFSVWLTEQSLIRLLRDVGFEQVQKLVYGYDEEDNWWADVRKDGRVLLVAVKKRPRFRSKVFGP
jgi:2-polyprenyl-3-methyl-5-hydroxy-6-metoxy-1,4-benzoquinol methylase